MSLPLSPAKRRYGALRSPKDPRDFKFSKLVKAVSDKLPSSVDLSAYCGPIRNQNQMGACTAFASTAMAEFMFKKFKSQSVVLSPLFQYYQERIMDGTFPQDSGSTGRTAVTCLNDFGVCLESREPYNDSQVAEVPTSSDIAQALSYKLGAYYSIEDIVGIKKCLVANHVAIVGFTVYDSFESDALASSGLMPMPDLNSESVLGGHEVCFVGYDDNVQCPNASKGAFKVQNSWGTDWGQSGFFYFPYDAVSNSAVFSDAYTQHFSPAVEPS